MLTSGAVRLRHSPAAGFAMPPRPFFRPCAAASCTRSRTRRWRESRASRYYKGSLRSVPTCRSLKHPGSTTRPGSRGSQCLQARFLTTIGSKWTAGPTKGKTARCEASLTASSVALEIKAGTLREYRRTGTGEEDWVEVCAQRLLGSQSKDERAPEPRHIPVRTTRTRRNTAGWTTRAARTTSQSIH